MDSDLLTYRIAFASVSRMGCDLANKFLDVIPSEKEFFTLSQKELQALTNSKSRILGDSYRQKKLEMAKREVEYLKANKIKVTYFTDDDFPSRLLNAPDSPILIYSMGNCNLNAKHTIAIVGTRHATAYGQHFVESLVEELSTKLDDFVIISGLAYGIDIIAHNACLKHGVPTVAVLAHGLNTIYPPSHRNYAIDIVRSNGMLVSDYSSQTRINKGNFVARNRIVAALADCTIVAESAEKGGALITAQLAAGYNRDVFALPGKTSDLYSVGCNKLIQNNTASLITCADDLLKAMSWESALSASAPRQKELFPEVTEEEQAILDVLTNQGEMHINTLTTTLKLPVYLILSTLVELEFKGFIISLSGCRYSLA